MMNCLLADEIRAFKEVKDIPIYKRCSRCGKRISSGTKCTCTGYTQGNKEYDQHRRDKRSKAFYCSSLWERTRGAALAADDGIDVYVYMTTGEVIAADTVHHIIPLKDDWERRCDVNNLMSLSHDTHSMIERMYKQNKTKMQKELSEMLSRYRVEGRSEKF